MKTLSYFWPVLLVAALVFFLCGSVMAQDPQTTTGISAGAAFVNSTSQWQGWGAFDKQLKGILFSYSGYDVVPLWQAGSKMPKLKFTAFTGLAARVAQLGKLGLWMQTVGGVATTGSTTSGAGNFGGFAHYSLGSGWGVIIGGQGSYSPIAGIEATLRFGFRYAVK